MALYGFNQPSIFVQRYAEGNAFRGLAVSYYQKYVFVLVGLLNVGRGELTLNGFVKSGFGVSAEVGRVFHG